MSELTIVRTVRDGLWLARDGDDTVLVRSVPEDRVALYERATRFAVPISEILYVGPDAAGQQYVVVEQLLGPEASRPEDRSWRNLASLAPVFNSDTDRVALALGRAAEALAWLHAAGFLHGNLAPTTIWFHPRGWVRFAGLDCLQPAPGPAPCIGYSRAYACQEQQEGWVVESTDVRLLAISFEGTIRGSTHRPTSRPADHPPIPAEHPLTSLLSHMAAVEAGSRPDLRQILSSVFNLR